MYYYYNSILSPYAAIFGRIGRFAQKLTLATEPTTLSGIGTQSTRGFCLELIIPQLVEQAKFRIDTPGTSRRCAEGIALGTGRTASKNTTLDF